MKIPVQVVVLIVLVAVFLLTSISAHAGGPKKPDPGEYRVEIRCYPIKNATHYAIKGAIDTKLYWNGESFSISRGYMVNQCYKFFGPDSTVAFFPRKSGICARIHETFTTATSYVHDQDDPPGCYYK